VKGVTASRDLRRTEIGHHHHIAGAYLLRYAREASWREDNRRVSNGDQVRRIVGLAIGRKPSVDFSGYINVVLAPAPAASPSPCVAVVSYGIRRDLGRLRCP
jgi:hypothetical protein